MARAPGTLGSADWRAIAALLFLAAILFIVLIDDPSGPAWIARGVLLALYLGIGSYWSWSADRAGTPAASAPTPRSALGTIHWRGVLRGLTVPVLLFALAWLAYFEPLRAHFWGGYDEFALLQHGPFSADWLGAPGGRPLLFQPVSRLARLLTPDRIEGFLWIAFALWYMNALLLRAILDRLFPDCRTIGVLAAVLLVTHDAEPLRYMFMWSAHAYLRPLFWFLLSTWLLIVSYQGGSRRLLFLSTIPLSIALLISEGLLPLILLVPVLLWAARPAPLQPLRWSALWLGMAFVQAGRFGHHLLSLGGSSYQAGQLIRGLEDVPALLYSLSKKVSLSLSWMGGLAPPARHELGVWLVAFALVAAAGLIGVRGGTTALAALSARRLRATLGLSLLAIVLAVLPFLHIPHTVRTQFFAAPGHATLAAVICIMVLRLLPERLSGTATVAVVALVAANLTVESLESQRAPKAIHFEKTAHVFEQIRRIGSAYAPDTLLVLALEQPDRPSLAHANYAACKLGQIVLDAALIQANYDDPLGEELEVRDAGVVHRCMSDVREFDYDQLVVFRLQFDGTLVLLDELPAELFPATDAAATYAPLSRMVAGDSAPLPYLQLPSWAAPVPDILAPGGGIVLGEGWGEKEWGETRISRQVGERAVLYLNPGDAESLSVRLDLEPASGAAVATLRNAAGEPLARTRLRGRKDWAVEIAVEGRQPFEIQLTVDRHSSEPTAAGQRLRIYSVHLAS